MPGWLALWSILDTFVRRDSFIHIRDPTDASFPLTHFARDVTGQLVRAAPAMGYSIDSCPELPLG